VRRLLSNRRVIATVVLVAGILAVALWPTPVLVDLATATRGPLLVTIDDEGETRVRERFVISAPVAGRLERIELEPGDRVDRGRTVLARLTPAEPALIDPRTRAELASAVEAARAALGQARAERERAGATLDRLKSVLKRQQALVGTGAISREELEESETAVRTAEEGTRAAAFAVSRAEYELQTAQARLLQPAGGGRRVEIVAPIDGVVLKRHRESEAVVPAGEPLLEIGNPDRLEVVADLLSTDAVRVSPGDRVLLAQWGGGEPLNGHVRRIEPSGFMKISALGVEEQRVNIIVDFDDPAGAARELGDGFRVEVRVVVWGAESVLKVPVSSLFRRGDGWAVFVLDGGRARLRPVTLGQRNDLEAQVVEGLAEGTPVIVHPPDTIRDGTRAARRSAT
jgi:HlyD family secretion protein